MLGYAEGIFRQLGAGSSFVLCKDGVFTIGAHNAHGRVWLARRLTSTLTRTITGILKQQLEIDFIVSESFLESEEEDNPSGRVRFNPRSQKAQFQELADNLTHHMTPPKDLIFLTHYIVLIVCPG